jgi:hypothetical protein
MRPIPILLALVVVLGFVPARGALIYDNFEPGIGYDIDSGWALSATSPTAANPFIVTSTPFRLERISLPLQVTVEFPNEIDVWLMDDAGGLPNAIIEAFHFSNAMPPSDGNYHPPLVANSILQPVLEPGSRYWVAASVAQYVTTRRVYASWKWNTTGDNGLFVYREAGFDQWFTHPGGGSPRGAYRVEGSPVPEPLSHNFTLLLALVTLLTFRWKRRAANRR